VSIAMQAGLFNIGAEGQMYVGGLGLTLAMLAFDAHLPAWLLIPIGMLGAALFGACGPSCRATCRPSAAATWWSRPSCSTSSPPA
jgi:ABC-type branched-subunit amino acid transport system permease subunit